MRRVLGVIYAGSVPVFIISLLVACFANYYPAWVIFWASVVASVVVMFTAGVLTNLVDWLKGSSNR